MWPAGGSVGSTKCDFAARGKPACPDHGPRGWTLVMGVCFGSLPRSTTDLGYGLDKLLGTGAALPAPKLSLGTQKSASDISLRESINLFWKAHVQKHRAIVSISSDPCDICQRSFPSSSPFELRRTLKLFSRKEKKKKRLDHFQSSRNWLELLAVFPSCIFLPYFQSPRSRCIISPHCIF